jgi:hypothetical protein
VAWPAENTITDLPLSVAVNTCRNTLVSMKVPSA